MEKRLPRRQVLPRLAVGFGSAVFGLRTLASADDHGQGPPRDDRPSREVVAEATLPGRKFTEGETVPISFRITNHTSEPVVIWWSGFWPNHRVDVRNAEGQSAPLTAAGKLRSQAFSPDGARRGKNVPMELKPGESWPRERTDPAKPGEQDAIRLDELFELGPGAFTVQVTYHDQQPPTPLKVVSPRQTFEIAPRDVQR